MPIKEYLNKRKKNKLKRLAVDKKLDVLKDDFLREIGDWKHFCSLQNKKRLIVKRIKDLWNSRWKKAEIFLKKDIPQLVDKQKKFLEAWLDKIQEENFFSKLFIK